VTLSNILPSARCGTPIVPWLSPRLWPIRLAGNEVSRHPHPSTRAVPSVPNVTRGNRGTNVRSTIDGGERVCSIGLPLAMVARRR